MTVSLEIYLMVGVDDDGFTLGAEARRRINIRVQDADVDLDMRRISSSRTSRRSNLPTLDLGSISLNSI